MKIKFNLENYYTSNTAFRAFENTKKLLDEHNIDYTFDIYNSDLFLPEIKMDRLMPVVSSTSIPGRSIYCKTFVINFQSEEDYSTYLIIKD